MTRNKMKAHATHPSRNKFLWLIGFLVLLFIIVLAVKYSKIKLRDSSDKQDVIDQSAIVGQVSKKTIPDNQMPEYFPNDIPQESGSKITENFNTTTRDGRKQATRSFETKKSLADNKKIYEDYFTKSGWEIVSRVDQDSAKALTASKGKWQLQVAITENTLTKVKYVDLNLVELP